jgi:hypothetical protein
LRVEKVMLANEIDPILSELGGSRCAPATGSVWHLPIPGGREARASLQENCLTFLSPPLSPASPWMTSQQNSRLGPGLRLILDQSRQRRLAAETLLLTNDRINIAERACVLFDRFADGVSMVSGGPQAARAAAVLHVPSSARDLRTLAEELDRPALEHESELILECGAGERAPKIRVRSDTTGLTVSFPLLKSGSLSQASLDALSLLFLRMSSSCRLVRAAAATADGMAFGFEVALFPWASAEEVDAALDCLLLLAGSCLDEAAVLQLEDAAQSYLAMSGGGKINPAQKGGEFCE